MSLLTEPASATGIASALEDSLAELRALEKMLFNNGQREAGVFLSQIKLIITKVQHGIAAGRTDCLSLLQAAQQIPKDGQGGKR